MHEVFPLGRRGSWARGVVVLELPWDVWSRRHDGEFGNALLGVVVDQCSKSSTVAGEGHVGDDRAAALSPGGLVGLVEVHQVTVMDGEVSVVFGGLLDHVGPCVSARHRADRFETTL